MTGPEPVTPTPRETPDGPRGGEHRMTGPEPVTPTPRETPDGPRGGGRVTTGPETRRPAVHADRTRAPFPAPPESAA